MDENFVTFDKIFVYGRKKKDTKIASLLFLSKIRQEIGYRLAVERIHPLGQLVHITRTGDELAALFIKTSRHRSDYGMKEIYAKRKRGCVISS